MLLEVCVNGIADARVAVEAGADRLELCCGLELGGLTPSSGEMLTAAGLGVSVIALIRPRAGDFVYTTEDIEVMERDILAARGTGLAGVAFGALTQKHALDVDALSRLCDAADGMEIVLHRAFDLTPDPMAAIEMAVDLGFDRVLTSGQANSAPKGAARIADIVKAAGDRITVLAGAGITAANAPDLILASGVWEIHASCSRRDAPSLAGDRHVDLGFAPMSGIVRTDPDQVRALKAAIKIRESKFP